jgi:hypothetical protein
MTGKKSPKLVSLQDLVAEDELSRSYLVRASQSMLDACMLYEHARAAEKMTNPNNVGYDNVAWSSGPYLAAPAGYPEIDRTVPYILRISTETSAVAQIILGNDPNVSMNGGVRLPMRERQKGQSFVEPSIAKLSIIEQFEIFKEFLVQFDGPYTKSLAKKWEGRVEQVYLDAARRYADRRNELTHEAVLAPPTMKEAVEFFYGMVQIGTYFYALRK